MKIKPTMVLLGLGAYYLFKGGKDRSCPRATQDLRYNTLNRNKAIKEDWIQYGPVNLLEYNSRCRQEEPLRKLRCFRHITTYA